MKFKDFYPLPIMYECIDSLDDVEVFKHLYTYNGYWKVAIEPQDRHKTSFICDSSTYQYILMPFGLPIAPATYQCALNSFLTKFKWKNCLVHVDDVIIYPNSVNEQITHVDEILTTLAEASGTLKMENTLSSSTKWNMLDISSVPVNWKWTSLTPLRYDKLNPRPPKANSFVPEVM